MFFFFGTPCIKYCRKLRENLILIPIPAFFFGFGLDLKFEFDLDCDLLTNIVTETHVLRNVNTGWLLLPGQHAPVSEVAQG